MSKSKFLSESGQCHKHGHTFHTFPENLWSEDLSVFVKQKILPVPSVQQPRRQGNTNTPGG